MAKIIEIDKNNAAVSVGFDNGKVQDVPLAAFKFKPEIGMQVDVYIKDDGTYIVNEVINSDIFSAKMSEHKVNKTAYILCALFLGGLGVHKFIAGRPLDGILYFVFSWTFIPSLVGIVEAIIVCNKKSDVHGMIEC